MLGDLREIDGGGEQFEDVMLERRMRILALGGVEDDHRRVRKRLRDLETSRREALAAGSGQEQDDHGRRGRGLEIVNRQAGSFEQARNVLGP